MLLRSGLPSLVTLLLILPAAPVSAEGVPPAPPRNVEAFYEESDGSVRLSWDPPVWNGSSPLTGYNIYRNGQMLASDIQGTQYMDSFGTRFDAYSVRAVSDDGESAPAPAQPRSTCIRMVGDPPAPIVSPSSCIQVVWDLAGWIG